VALLANLDVLLPTILAGASADLAGYQVSATLGRAPVFFALALATVVFPRLSAALRDPAGVLRTASDFFLRTAVPVAVVIGTIPDRIVSKVFPPEYGSAAAFLPYTAASGIMISVMYLLVAAYQAEQRFRTGARLLGTALAIHGGVLIAGLAVAGLRGLAVGTLVGSVAAAFLVSIHSARVWPGWFRPRPAAALGVAWGGLLIASEHDLLAWSVCAAIALAGAGWTMLEPHLTGRTFSSRHQFGNKLGTGDGAAEP
jgi:O-antigen/teichoic acid export membrane protein